MKTKVRFLFLVLCACTISMVTKGQDDWFAHFGGDDYQRTSMMARDASNNVYLCGSFRGNFDADPGEGVQMLSAGTYEDIYVIKLDENGEFVWSFDIGSGNQDFAERILIDNEGNIHITGTFQGAVDFDPGPGTHILETVGNPLLSSNMYVAKYGSDGAFIHALHFRTIDDSQVSRNTFLAIDADGNLIVSGTINGTVDMDPLEGNTILTPDTDFGDVVIAKLTSTGILLWAIHFNGDIGDTSADVTVDGDGNIYCTGLFRSTIDFDPGAGTAILAPQGGDTFNDIFILSLDGDGNFRWVKGIGWDGAQNGRFLEMGQDGFLYAFGVFSNTVDFNPGGDEDMTLTSNGGDDCYMMKMDTEGEVQWAKSWGGLSGDFIRGLNLGLNNEITVAGSFNSSMDLTEEAIGVVLNPVGGYDGYVLTWDDNGELTNAFSFGGDGDDHARMAIRDQNNRFLLTGDFDDEMQLQPGNPNAFFESLDDADAFLAYFIPSSLTSSPKAESRRFTVFPNPSSGWVQVQLIKPEFPCNISLLNAQGRKIKSWTPQSEHELDVSGITPGLYYLILETSEGRSSQKLVIE